MKRSDWQESKYVSQKDIGTAQVDCIIEEVVMEEVDKDAGQQKPVMYFKGKHKGLCLNNTTWTECELAFGEDSDLWKEHKVILYVDPSVTFKGKRTGGLRLKAFTPEPVPAAVASAVQEEGGEEPPF